MEFEFDSYVCDMVCVSKYQDICICYISAEVTVVDKCKILFIKFDLSQLTFRFKAFSNIIKIYKVFVTFCIYFEHKES